MVLDAVRRELWTIESAAGTAAAVSLPFLGWYAVGGLLSPAGTTRAVAAFVLVTVTVVGLARLERRYVTEPPTGPAA